MHFTGLHQTKNNFTIIKVLYSFIGAICFGLAVILGITSLPSVTDVLTWKEFAFVQSKLGWLCLCFGTAHDLFLGFKSIFVHPSVECSFFLHGTMVRNTYELILLLIFNRI